MALETPTISTVTEQLNARLIAKFPEFANAPAKSAIGALIAAVAGAIHQTRAAVPLIAEQAHPATATGEPLTKLAEVWGLTREATESDGDLRDRLHAKIRSAASVGTIGDWRYWTKLLPGVTRASVTGGSGLVKIGIIYENRASPAPTTAELTAARTFLEKYRAAGIELSVSAATTEPLTVTVASLSPDTSATRIAVTAALQETIQLSQQNPGDAVSVSLLYTAALQVVDSISFTAPASDATPENPANFFSLNITYPA